MEASIVDSVTWYNPNKAIGVCFSPNNCHSKFVVTLVDFDQITVPVHYSELAFPLTVRELDMNVVNRV